MPYLKDIMMPYNKDRMSKVNNDLTWSWLGGFFQAEGCISGRTLVLPQKDRRPLDLIRDFLISEFPSTSIPEVRSYASPLNSFKPGSIQHRLSIRTATPRILARLIPYLHREKRLTLPTKILTLLKQQPIDDEWIAGFWEGDGSIWSANTLQFYQKDRYLLEEIRNCLGHGNIKPRPNYPDNYLLSISISLSNVRRIGELLSHVKSAPRLEQLEKIET